MDFTTALQISYWSYFAVLISSLVVLQLGFVTVSKVLLLLVLLSHYTFALISILDKDLPGLQDRYYCSLKTGIALPSDIIYGLVTIAAIVWLIQPLSKLFATIVIVAAIVGNTGCVLLQYVTC